MKIRRICLALSVLLMLSVCGCMNGTEADSAKLHIVTTIYPPADFAAKVGGDLVSVHQLLKPGAESHTYELTPQDIKRIQDCDLFIYTGGESDTWIEEVLSTIDTGSVCFLRMTDAVSLLDEEIQEGMQSHEVVEEDEEEEEMDEHVWTSPKNAILITEAIAEQMMELDPEDRAYFRSNADSYEDELQKLHEQYQTVLGATGRHEIIVADRFPFRYLAHEYNLDYCAAFPGCSEDSEVSAKTIAYLIDRTKQDEINCVFHIEFSNEKIADSVCEVTGARKLLLHSCHNLSAEELSEGKDYVSVMYDNLANLKEALQ